MPLPHVKSTLAGAPSFGLLTRLDYSFGRLNPSAFIPYFTQLSWALKIPTVIMDAPALTMTSCHPFGAHENESSPEVVQSTGADTRPDIRRRRHSHFIPRRRKSIVSSIMEGEEAVILKVRSLSYAILLAKTIC